MKAAEEYARRLQNDLDHAEAATQHYHLALTQCEASLVASLEKLNKEAVDHRACQEALTFERERHNETITLLERTFQAALWSGAIADDLGNQVVMLRAASSSQVSQGAGTFGVSRLDASQTNESLSRGSIFISDDPPSESVPRLLPAFPSPPESLTVLDISDSTETNAAGSTQVTKLEDFPRKRKRRSRMTAEFLA